MFYMHIWVTMAKMMVVYESDRALCEGMGNIHNCYAHCSVVGELYSWPRGFPVFTFNTLEVLKIRGCKLVSHSFKIGAL